MADTWFHNAVFYSLDVETFYDSDGDGVGDFRGLTSRLDYLAGLGVTCIWLLPFYPSPNRDNGYDVMDYYGIDRRLGDPGDFTLFMEKCGEYGIKVIVDLVINHTSVQHPWFQQARKNKDSIYRKFYIWSDKPRKYKMDLMFEGEVNTVWTYDEAAGAYYFHRFYQEQPDLNISCPELRQEILKIVGYWLRQGVSGFRLDAAEMLIESYGTKRSTYKMLDEFLSELRTYVKDRDPQAILLAETNIPPEETGIYLRKKDRMHMLFNFYSNQHFFLSLAGGKSRPLSSALEKLPRLHSSQQWLNFLRHHDELSLRLLSGSQRKKVFQAFGPKQNMQIFGKGIRRRLSPMLNSDPGALRLSYSVLFSLPGAVLIRYGDEIGMGDNLSLPGRTSVRTPMQWSSSPNGGFSEAAEKDLVHPVIAKGKFGYKKVNVLSQQATPGSLLNFIERLITTRKQTPEIGLGKFKILYSGGSVLGHECEWKSVRMIFVHNFSNKAMKISAGRLGAVKASVFDIFRSHEPLWKKDHLHIPPFGYYWFRTEK